MKAFSFIFRFENYLLKYLSLIIIGIECLIIMVGASFPQEALAKDTLSSKIANSETKTGYFEGFVKNAQTLDPWNGATVFLFNKVEGKVYVAKTNKLGKYLIKVPVPCDGVVKAMDKNTFNDCMTFSIDLIQTDSVQQADRDLLLEKIMPSNQHEQFDPTLYHNGQQFDYNGSIMQHVDFSPCLVVSGAGFKHKTVQSATTVSDNHYVPVVIPFEGDVLQLGAFKIKKGAFGFEKKVAEKSGKDVIIVYADGFHKVQIPGFPNRNKVWEYVPQLKRLGFNAIYIPIIKASVSVQIGVFSKEADALDAQKTCSKNTNHPVIIVYVQGMFKVLITGFPTKTEAEAFIEHMDNSKKP